MQNRPTEAIAAVIVNATHHQRGEGCSTTPAIRSVIQLKFRRFNTSGTRASGRSGEEDASPRMMSGTVDPASICLGVDELHKTKDAHAPGFHCTHLSPLAS